MPDRDLALLRDAARAAGDIALRHWRRNPKAWEKPGDAGPVTEADIAVDRMLRDELLTARPGYGWLSEESEDEPVRLSAGRVFIVDPIDGTRAFIAGEETFAHSLAIADHGRITAAVVYLPALDRLYSAGEDDPARMNGATISVSAADSMAGASVLTPAGSLRPENWRGGVVPAVRRVFRSSLAYRLCLVAEGRFDAMMTLRDTWEWDVAAGDLILRKAGGQVTDRGGREITYNAAHPRMRGLIGGPVRLQSALVEALEPV